MPLEFCFGLIALAIFLAIWVAVGHGLWLLGEALYREVFGKKKIPGLSRDCPQCHRPGGVMQGRCVYCGYTSHTLPAISEQSDREAVVRHLASLRNRGQITPEQYRHLQTMLLGSPALAEPERQPLDAEVVFLDRADSQAATSAGAPAAPLPEPGVEDLSSEEAAWHPPAPSQVVPPPVAASPFAAEAAPSAVLPPTRPSRSLAEMLQAFLEEKNIRWGEIIAGLFIVISAVGLIISLRNTLKAIPYFPALMFMVFTVLFHGAGLYSLRKWKLHAVSRVVLIISLLLVPLSFGAGIVLSGTGEAKRPLTDPYVALAILVGLAAFSWVTWSAARELISRAWWQLFLAVMGTAVGQVVINRWPVEQPGGWSLVALAVLPVVSFLVPLGVAIAWDLPAKQLTRRRAGRLLLLGGIGLFALLVPLALLIFNAADRRRGWAELAPLLSLSTAGLLALGLVLHRKVVSTSLATWRTAGTSIAILATVVLLTLLALAWPWPAMLVAVGLIDGVALISLAVLLELSLLHAAGVAALTVAYLVGFHWLRGALPSHDEITSQALFQAILEIPSALALTVANVAAMIVAVALRQRGTKEVSRIYLASAAGMAIVVLALTANAAFAPWMAANAWPVATSAIFVFYAAAFLLTTQLVPHAALPAIAAVVWWLGLVHLLTFDTLVRSTLEPLSHYVNLVQFPTLLHGLSTAVVACLFARSILFASDDAFRRWLSSRRWRIIVLPLVVAALVSSIVAIVCVLASSSSAYFQRAIDLGAIAVAWLLLTWITRQPTGVTATQLAVHAAAAMAIAGRWSGFENKPDWYAYAPHLVEQLAGIAAPATLWSVVRVATERFSPVRRVLRAAWPTVDEIMLPGAAIALLLVAFVGLAPAISAEFGWQPRDPSAPLNSWTLLAFEPLSWVALVILAGGFAVRLWERIAVDALAGLTLVMAMVPLLAAGAWVEQDASVSALRWGLAVFLASATAVVAARDHLLGLARRVSRWREASLARYEVEQLRSLALALGGGPIVVLTCMAVVTSLAGTELGGPQVESFFGGMGLNVSYGVPLLVLVGSLVAFALREQDSRFAMAGAVVFQGAANLALLLYLKDAKLAYVRDVAALSLQVNALACGAFALLWLALDPWIEREPHRRWRFPRLIDLPLVFLTRLVAVIALWAAAAVIVSPATVAPWDARLAGPFSFLASALTVIAMVWRYGRRLLAISVQGVLLLLTSLAALVALASDHFVPTYPWRGFFVLETSLLGIGLAGTIGAWLRSAYHPRSSDSPIETTPGHEEPAPLSLWLTFWTRHVNVPRRRLHHTLAWRSVVLTTLAAALAVYAGWSDPLHPWYSLAILAVAQVCFVGQGILLRSQRVPYLALIAAIATGVVIWGEPAWPWLRTGFLEPILRFIDITGLVVAAVSFVWLGVELWFQRRGDETLAPTSPLFPVHHVTGWLLVVGTFVAAMTGWILLPGWMSADGLFVLRTETTVFMLVVGTMLLAMLWDRRGIVVPMAYLWGIAATAFTIVVIYPPRDWAVVSLVIAAAAYVAITSHLWKWGADLAGLGLRLGIPDPVAGLVRTSWWLPGMNIVASVGLAIAAVAAVLLLPQRDMRMAASITPLLLAWCASSLAQERRKDAMLVATYLFGALAAACLGWADLDPDHSALTWLHRTIRLLMALSFATLLYGLVVARYIFASGDWNKAARRAGALTGLAAVATLVVVLAQEFSLYQPLIGVPVSVPQIVAVSVVLVGLIVGLFSLALLPGHDPLSLREEGRMYYVYAAEATAGLLFAHLYMARPEMFETLRPYWPYIIVTLAFAGVGVGELMQRSGIRVLAQPFERTGGLLPLLPALGMWFLASQSDYSIVLFAIGLVYLMHCWLRQSLASGLAAAVAGNGALWAWLSREEGRSFFEHPQLWLIPPALSTLLAAHLQRRRLDPATLTAIRYAATLVIYLSSTSEMFIVGLGNSLWPPMVLALLGLTGAFAGMLLQIRAFLYLGAGFVLLALVSMVAHAAQAIDHVWPWWAFGIGVGLAILVLFGIFEKKRAEVMTLIERLRHWEN